MSTTTSPPPTPTQTHESLSSQIQLGEGQDASVILPQLEKLLTTTAERHRWYLCQEGRGVQRKFKFKTFKTTWEFMDVVAQRMKTVRHHAEWWNSYNQILIQWTTHQPLGLTVKDIDMAVFCNEKARELGEVDGEVDGKRDRRVVFGVAEVEF